LLSALRAETWHPASSHDAQEVPLEVLAVHLLLPIVAHGS
jgi:hypothetical protein